MPEQGRYPLLPSRIGRQQITKLLSRTTYLTKVKLEEQSWVNHWIIGYTLLERGKLRKDPEGRESHINIDYLEEHNLLEMKVTLEEEMLKNETLERQMRNMEFEQLR